jgi:ribosomal protein S18 acetylase RimI-like enzyme
MVHAIANAIVRAVTHPDVVIRALGVDEPLNRLGEAFSRLVPQLSTSSPPPDEGALAEIIDNPNSVLFVAELDGQIVGSLTLATYRIPTGLKAIIEDVVVESEARGLGIGESLSAAAIEEARRRGAKDVTLSSRPEREAANRLYLRIGFEKRNTNVYRIKF